MQGYEKCTLCPRECKVNRESNLGFCGESSNVRVARASLHMWEEPCISGSSGSGTVFFTGCNLKCVFCQNSVLANNEVGTIVSVSKLSDLFLKLQEKGAANINLVTPSHFIPSIASALTLAKNNGLYIPIVYNTSGYDSVSSLRLLEGLVDIYLPDMKYVDSALSAKFSHAPDYFSVASEALSEMFSQVPTCIFDESGMMKKGIIVRHLVLPGHKKNSKEVLQYLFDTYKDSIFISIMNQYTPLCLEALSSFPELQRKVTKKEYDEVLDFAISLGITNAFIQEGKTAQESFIPDFTVSEIPLN